ncbi:MAG: chloramphenicol acetyltransferase [Pseudooceanicola sp.]|jgi:acetyltransferase-like isoleucine patch superfamily enzyme|nr:chloramphenicol acetyltransferase [Pseudooceanicola sp.]
MPRQSDTTARIAADCEIENSTLGAFSALGLGSRLINTALGAYSSCDTYCDIANAQIGKFVHIGAFVRLGAPDGMMRQPGRVTTLLARRHTRKVHIGHDCWIGHGAEIRPGVSIGDGAIVAPGAVVSRNIAPFTIVAGVPARMVRLRYPKAIADRMAALAWWHWDHDMLRARLVDMRSRDAASFLDRYEMSRSRPRRRA